MSRPWTIEYSPPAARARERADDPLGHAVRPSLGIAIDTQSPSGVPSVQSRMWSTAADAADAADDAPRASMIAAPRLATVGMYVWSYQSWSPTAS